MPIYFLNQQCDVLTVCCEDIYKFDSDDMFFIKMMSNLIGLMMHLSNDSYLEYSNKENIVKAKKQWEIAIDSLPQLVIALNHDAKLIRVNRTIESWGVGDVHEVNGLLLVDFIKPIINCQVNDSWDSDWLNIWCSIETTGVQGWIEDQNNVGKIYQFTLRKVIGHECDNYSADDCYAILVIDDITTHHIAENSLKRHTLEMEKKVIERTLELEQANVQLEHKIQVQKQDKISLDIAQECRLNLLHELINVQESERKRIAGELHDSIGQSLGAIKYNVEDAINNAPDGVRILVSDKFCHVVEKIQNVINEVREIAMELRPAMLDDLGVLATLSWFCKEFTNTYSNIKVNHLINVNEYDISDEIKVVIFRIVQEAMNNVVKHTKATRINLELNKSVSGLCLSVSDNGVGFVKTKLHEKNKLVSNLHFDKVSGYGLNSMRERSESTSGEFSIESMSDGGTCVRVLWAGAEQAACN